MMAWGALLAIAAVLHVPRGLRMRYAARGKAGPASQDACTYQLSRLAEHWTCRCGIGTAADRPQERVTRGVT